MLYRVTAKVKGMMQIEGMRPRKMGNAIILDAFPLEIQAGNYLDTELDVQPWVDEGYLIANTDCTVIADPMPTIQMTTVVAKPAALVIEMTTPTNVPSTEAPIFVPYFFPQEEEPLAVTEEPAPIILDTQVPISPTVAVAVDNSTAEKKRQGRRSRRKDIANG